MNWSLFGRYFLEITMLYPAALLCYLPARQGLRIRPQILVPAVLCVVTGLDLLGALICTWFAIPSNYVLIPIMLMCLALYAKTLSFSRGKVLYMFWTSAAITAPCTLLATILNAQQEVFNPQSALSPTTSAIGLGLSLLAIFLYGMLLASKVEWLTCEFEAQHIWNIVWLFPAFFTALYIVMMPWDPATILVNRVQQLGGLLTVVFSFILFFFTQIFYKIAKGLTVNARLAQENQLLSVEANRYAELRGHMEETRALRHDFRQHLHVISGLAANEKLEDLQQYLHQFQEELNDQRPILCNNAAVDAIAGHYDMRARDAGISVYWQMQLPADLPMPETDFCMMLGNLLENALLASMDVPEKQRDLRVLCQMRTPTILGLIVENRYTGTLKRDREAFISTRHESSGTGLLSVQTIVRRYGGQLTIETENQIFSVNILLNLCSQHS